MISDPNDDCPQGRPIDTAPFIGRPRHSLIDSDAFQDACAARRLRGETSREIMRALRCTDGEQYVAWYRWLGRHPERYIEALQHSSAAHNLAHVQRYAPSCTPMLLAWRAAIAHRTARKSRQADDDTSPA
jgi:hypothetical protein